MYLSTLEKFTKKQLFYKMYLEDFLKTFLSYKMLK